MAKQSRIANPRRRMAAAILKCGTHRVWFSPDIHETVKQAITRADLRKLIHKGKIKKFPVKHRSKPVVKRKQRAGSRKGRAGSRRGKKTEWLKIIRPQRRCLSSLRSEDKLTPNTYRRVYRLIKGGTFRSKSHLMTFLKENKMVKNNA